MNRKLGVRGLVLGVSLAFLICLTLVSAVPQTINVHGKLSNSTEALTGTYSINFSIYSAYTGGGSVYESVRNVTTDGSGVYNVVLAGVDLNFTAQYYLGITVESDAEMTPRINLTSSPYAFMAQNVSVGGIIFDGNVGIGTTNPGAKLHTTGGDVI
ncbi:MAG: hypothetical protein KJ592_03610, partial [Nanoarchaeota archaeon]|nr:hypothetical protein [Nanoarchaeota archaeon]